MSDDTAQQLMEMYDKWNQRDERQRFLSKMSHKHNARERNTYRSHR